MRTLGIFTKFCLWILQRGLPKVTVPSLDDADVILGHSLSVVLLAFMESYSVSKQYAVLGQTHLDVNQVGKLWSVLRFTSYLPWFNMVYYVFVTGASGPWDDQYGGVLLLLPCRFRELWQDRGCLFFRR